MYLIDKTYFRNKLEIIGLYDDNNKAQDKLTDYISIYVIDFLQRLLGLADFTQLNSNISNGVLSNNAPQKWLDFVNGKTYTKDGKTYRWEGLLYLRGSVKMSILTNIVYCKLMTDLFSNNGKATITTKNSIQSVPSANFCEAYNEIVKQLHDERFFKQVYFINDVPFIDYYGSEKTDYVTLSEYLKDHKDVYTNVNFDNEYKEYKNSFDI
jgi:hypothetical protein